MTKKIKLKIDKEVATMVLLEDKAPSTGRRYQECLPIKTN
jgi:hypothetical protein